MSSRAGRQDLPARELARQLRALPAPLYEFAVFDGRTTRRVWRHGQALRSIGWLAHRNSRGGNVYVRPVTAACVLVDGLTADGLAEIRADGLTAAAVTEASPAVFQAWFRLGRELEPRLATAAVQVLAARYGADPGSVDVRRPGRAAGFRNRKAELAAADGRYPRVRLDEARGRVTPKADELVADALERLARREAERAAAGRPGKGGNAGRRAKDPGTFLAREVARLAERHGKATDPGRALAAAARAMALAGYERADVSAALRACPALRGKKGDRVGDYAARTAAWAFGLNRRRPR